MKRMMLATFAMTILFAATWQGAIAADDDDGIVGTRVDVTVSEAEASYLSGGLTPLDWAIIAVYGIGTLLMGWYYGRRQKSTKEYFVGSGKMNPLLVGVSLFATLLSTISYLSMPGESLGKGPVNMMSMFAFPLVFFVVGYGILPLYMKQKVTSAYELLEERLGKSVRLLGAIMFITLRLFWMSLLIFLTAKALTIMLGVEEDWIPWIAIATGLVAVTYTTMGGLRAVVVTDFVQTVLLFGGAWLVIATITYRLGGIGWIPTEWNPAWDTQPLYSLDPATRVTVLGTLLNYTVWYICTSGGDQTSVQRFMATSDASAARKAFATQLSVSVMVAITLGLVGFAMLAYFEQYPERLGTGLTIQDNADEIFPHFIAFHLPPGISGLVVAAMFAAAMSSVDSGVNSISAVLMTDIVDQAGLAPNSKLAPKATDEPRLHRTDVANEAIADGVRDWEEEMATLQEQLAKLRKQCEGNQAGLGDVQQAREQLVSIAFNYEQLETAIQEQQSTGQAIPEADSQWLHELSVEKGTLHNHIEAEAVSERFHIWWSRGLAFLIGVVVVLASSTMGAIPGNITSVTTKTANLLTTPIFGLFFFAMFVPFASPRGVWVGAIFGTMTAVLIAFSGPIFGYVPGTDELDPISFQWIAPIAFLVNATTGSIASLLLPRKQTTKPPKGSF